VIGKAASRRGQEVIEMTAGAGPLTAGQISTWITADDDFDAWVAAGP
jgi:hypothetical protein